MALCKKVVGHPKFFEALKELANGVPQKEIDKMMTAARIVKSCKAALKEVASGKRITWIDPTEVETEEDWKALREIASRSGRPFGDDTIWDPAATATMTLSTDEFVLLDALFKEHQSSLNVPTLVKLMTKVMLDAAVQVEMKA